MENFGNVRQHICDRMHSWYTDDDHSIPVCPYCNEPPKTTNDPCDPNSESCSLNNVLGNYAAAAITASRGDDFLAGGNGWGNAPKVKYWELVIHTRFEQLKEQLNSKDI